MAQVIGRNVQLSHTGQQLDDAIRSENNEVAQSIVALAALEPTVGKVVTIRNVGTYLWVDSDTTTADGTTVIESTVADYAPGGSREGRWHLLGSKAYSSQFGVVGGSESSATSNTTNLQLALDTTAALKVQLIHDVDSYVNGKITIKGDADFGGRIIWGTDAPDTEIEIARSETEVDIPYASLTASDLVRGSTKIGGLEAYRGYTVTIVSTEAAITRTTGANYAKQVCLHVVNDAGGISPEFPYDISDPSTLTITAYPPEQPITVKNLKAEIAHSDTTATPKLRVHRSNVTLECPRIYRTGSEDGQAYGIRVASADNVVINAPVIDGFNDSTLGYGIALSVASNITINDASIFNCKHAVSGRDVFNLRCLGGYYDGDIDCHWGYGLIADGCRVRDPIHMAGGGPVIIENCVFEDSKFILKIRDDTPELRGKVVIKDCSMVNSQETGNVYVIAYGNASQDYAGFGRRLVQPENVVIDNIDYEGPGPTFYGVFAVGGIGSGREYDHTIFGDITISRLRASTALIRPVDMHINAGYQTLKENAPDWGLSEAKAVRDYVTNDGATYLCYTAHTTSSTDEPGVGVNWKDYWSRVPNPTITLLDMDAWSSVGPELSPCIIKTWGATRNSNLGYQLIVDNFRNFQPDIHEDAIQDRCVISNCSMVTDIRGWSDAAWMTLTDYEVGDQVLENDANYVCLEDHTSGTFATDLAASKWLLLTPGSEIQFNNCVFKDEFLFAHKGYYRFYGGVIEGKLTSSPSINGRIRSSVGVALTADAMSWANANQIGRTGVKHKESLGPQADHQVGSGDNPSFSSSTYDGQTNYLAVTEDEDVEVGYGLFSNDGTNDRRVKLFLLGGDRVYGWWQDFSSGRMDMVWGVDATEVMRLKMGDQDLLLNDRLAVVSGSGSTAPNSDHDETLGYRVGSTYVDTAAGNTYVCTDATDGAATWVQTN